MHRMYMWYMSSLCRRSDGRARGTEEMPKMCHNRGTLQAIPVGYQIAFSFLSLNWVKVGLGKEFLAVG